jgi:tol-pal system protein YbgF
MRFTQSWLAVGALVVALVLPGVSWANSSLEERIARLEQVLENQITTDVFDKLEALQQENSELRGALELQEHEIKKLHDRQKQLYSDVDHRLNNNVKSANKDTNASIEQNLSKIEKIETNDVAKAISENSVYKNAYDLIENKHYTQAEIAFKDFLWQYPDSKYAANAHYWLGEIYLAEWQKNKDSQLLIEQAAASFKVVTDKYNQHHKAVDAMFKLGVLEAEQGNWQAAKQYLENLKLKYPESSRVRMAEAKLQELKQRGNI